MFGGLGRGIDIRLVSNRIFAGGFLVFLAGFIALAAFGDRLTYAEAVTSAISVAIAWMIGRELDPDHVHVATLAMVLAGAAVFVDVPNALITGAAMLTLRMTTGTVGRFLTASDLLLVAIVGFGSGGEIWAWPIGIFALVWLKEAPEVGPLRWWAVGVLAVSFVGAFYLADLDVITVSTETLALAGAVAVVAAVSIIRVSTVSPTDRSGGHLDNRRLRMSRLAAGTYLIVAAVVGGTEAFWDIAPIAAGLGTAALASIVLVVRGVHRPTVTN
ncbi:MAG: hypothetical protein M5U23_02235 [Acidimicrobiia bacterium]|nr:hypothetical protein [Acidimicrobiia bacterium]